MTPDWEKLIVSVVGLLIVMTSFRAGMMPMSAPDIGREQLPYVPCGQV